MKNKTKRTITITMALIMIFMTFAQLSFAEEESSDAKIQRLIENGYIQGYTDGSLGLERNITRAELATIITRGMKLEDLANTLQHTNTVFSDVHPGSWDNGYIAVANTKGVVQGYPNGTFRPENNVTYGEAITMIVRMVLTPEERSMVDYSGKWPLNYYLKANEMGLLNDVYGIDVKEVATRENVFLILANAVVQEEIKSTTEVDMLIVEKNDDSVRASVLRDSGKFKERDMLNIGSTEEIKDKVEVGDIYTIKITDDGNVTSIKESENAKFLTGEIIKNRDDLKIENKNYGTDSLIKLLYNNDDKAFKSFPTRVEFGNATLYYGKLVYVRGYNFDKVLIVEEVKNNRIYTVDKDGVVNILNTDKKTNISLINDGKVVNMDIKDIKAGDIVYVQNARRNEDIFITNKKAIGKIEDINEKNNSVKINDKEYSIETNDKMPTIVGQGKRYFAIKDVNKIKGLKDNEVEISLNLNNRVQFVKADKDISIPTKAIIEEIDRDRIYVVTENGYRDYFYVTEMTELITGRRSSSRDDRYDRYDRYRVERIMSQLSEDDVIKVLVDGRGDIEELEILTGKEGVISYIDWDVVEVDGRDQYLAEDFVIFSKTNGVYRVEDFYDFEDIFYENRDARVVAMLYESNREIEVIVIERVSEGAKKELLDRVKDTKEILEIAEKYKENKNIESQISKLKKLANEIELNIEKLNDKEIEKYRKDIETAISNLEKETLKEILAQISQKIELVEKSNKTYNEEEYNKIKTYVAEIPSKKIEDYLKTIKEAEKILEEFEEKVYDSIPEFDKKLNELEEMVRVEILNVDTVLERAVYNNAVVESYKLFLTMLKNEIPNIKDIESVVLWEEELNSRKEIYNKDRFNLGNKHENLKEVFFLEERISVANELLAKTEGGNSSERNLLQSEVSKATRFAAGFKNVKDPEKIDINKVFETDENLRRALVNLAGRVNIPFPENKEIRKVIIEAEKTRIKLISNGDIDEALILNELILELKAYAFAGNAQSVSIERIVNEIQKIQASEEPIDEEPIDEEPIDEEPIDEEQVDEEQSEK